MVEKGKILFGTDGIRGKVGIFPITPDGFNCVGQACLEWLLQQDLPLNIAIGWDTRASGRDLAQAFADGFGSFQSQDLNVFFLGVTPTPAVSFYVQQNRLSLGVAITASHNPCTDNGLKLFKSTGSKLTREEEAVIEMFCQKKLPFGKCKKVTVVSGSEAYVQYWKHKLIPCYFGDRKVVIDASNGAAVFTTLPLLKYLGIEVVPFSCQPNGFNINCCCGSEYADHLKAIVKKEKAWLGFAHDGDGDRLVVIDEKGKRLDGDVVLGILALHFKKNRQLQNNCLVVTEQSNSGLASSLKSACIHVVTCPIGDREVFYALEKEGGCLGGENSGHIIFKNEAPTGDGFRVLVKLLELARTQPLYERARAIVLRPKYEATLPVKGKVPLERCMRLQQILGQLQQQQGRIYIRYSGTENKLRFLVEAETQVLCEKHMQVLQQAVKLDFQNCEI